jgi:GrpB-like predicted nucleotidyltransferase (UPF0157 family)
MTNPTPDTPEQPPESREVILREYDPAWPRLYEQWRNRILEACGPLITEIHHIGSTAVPGLLAKPVIDIMPGVADFEDGFSIVRAMQELGFESRGEFGLPLRHYFNRTDVHVHVYPVGQGQWHHQLVFRDHLRNHQAARNSYAALKRKLQSRHRFDPNAYTEAKSAFITAALTPAQPPTNPS